MAHSSWRRGAGALLTLVGFTHCVPLLDQDGLPCPCSGEYVCCESAQICVLPGEACPGGSGASSSSGRKGGDDLPSAGSNLGGKSSSAGSDAGGTPASSGSDAGGAFVAGAGGQGELLGGGAGAGGETNVGGAGDGGGGAGGECNIVASACSNYPRKSNVLVLFYNPVLASGKDVRESLGLPDARAISAELSERLRASSGGLLNYEIVEAREIRAFPPQRPGTMPLDSASFTGGVYNDEYVNYEGEGADLSEGALNADYGAIFVEQQLCSAVQAQNISEIWLWGAHSGEVSFGFEFFSYRLAGDALPESASEADRALYRQRRRNIPDCGRTLFLLGAQYTESGAAIGSAHRSYNFRAVELLGLALRTQSSDSAAGQAVWNEFSQTQLGPEGSAQVGTPWQPPNAGVGPGNPPADEDYGNLNEVLSGADRWLTYPDLTGTSQALTCTAWGCTNEGYQSWYSQHLPRRPGLAPSGSCANWWQYVADPDASLEPCCGSDCHPPAALGSVCASDHDCASGHCACAGTAVCVADAVEACGRPNWSLCEQDSDCESKVCGCNLGPSPKKCLPNSDYPRDCSQ